MNQLIYLFLLSVINPMTCKPNLCKDGKPYSSFTTLAKLVNDSYLLVNHFNEYIVFDESSVSLDHFWKVDHIKTQHKNDSFVDFKFETVFVMYVDDRCANTIERIFVINPQKHSKDKPIKPYSYTSYWYNGWNTIETVDKVEIFREMKTHHDLNTYEAKDLIYVFFESIGLLVIDPTQDKLKSVLAQCSPNGWQYIDNALQYEDTSFRVTTKFDIAFVEMNNETDEKELFFFERSSVGSDGKHFRNKYSVCSFKLKSDGIFLSNCQSKGFDTLCVDEAELRAKGEQLLQTIQIGAFLLLIILSAIVLLIIGCLCRPKVEEQPGAQKPVSSSMTTDTSATNTTMAKTMVTSTNYSRAGTKYSPSSASSAK